MKSRGISHIGNIRNNNEDYFYLSEDCNFPLFIVADGIGGNNYGEVASKMAVDIIKEHLKNIDEYSNLIELENDFIKAISTANKKILEKSEEEEIYSGMGTTITILYYYKDCMLIGNVGDSRAYAISESEIRQLTEDDTIVNKLLKLGEISQLEAENHPNRNIITNAVGTDLMIDINLIQYNFSEGEYILLCTDGLTDMVKNNEILEIINSDKDLDVIVERLLDKALKSGGKDNITFIVIEI